MKIYVMKPYSSLSVFAFLVVLFLNPVISFGTFTKPLAPGQLNGCHRKVHSIGFADGSEAHTVMAVNGLNLRAENNAMSESLHVLPFGSIIYSFASHANSSDRDTRYNRDTIDGVIGHWIDAESKAYKLKGYLFSPYVVYGKLGDNSIGERELRLTHEGYVDGDFDFHPELHWYGVYMVADSFRIEEVEVDLQLLKVTFDSMVMDLPNFREDGMILKTSIKKYPCFL